MKTSATPRVTPSLYIISRMPERIASDMISRRTIELTACKALNISPITATATRITAILPAIGQTRAPQCFARRRGFFFFALFMSFPPV